MLERGSVQTITTARADSKLNFKKADLRGVFRNQLHI